MNCFQLKKVLREKQREGCHDVLQYNFSLMVSLR